MEIIILDSTATVMFKHEKLKYCGKASASQIGIINSPGFQSAFIVRTYQGSGLAGCQSADLAFFVRVTGRKD
jgi:hypothetical protein